MRTRTSKPALLLAATAAVASMTVATAGSAHADREAVAGSDTSVSAHGTRVTVAPHGTRVTSAPKAAAADVHTSVVWKNVWTKAPSEWGGPYGPTGGYLNAGPNYFYCQGVGGVRSDHGYTNNHWLITDDDNGNRRVYVNAIYVSGGGDMQPIPGVPFC